ncbi:MAG: DUF2079 domain-containing protein [Candidatus Eremiobacteraeota bacterium]|nr:DUF2079 domain-containing protein [Candidatus Eremiobacteraeota bacterium]
MRDRFLWIAVGVYAGAFTVLGSIKYDVHRNLVDFGIFAQTAASAFGCFCNTVEGSHWAYHFSPILYLAGAVVGFVRSPFALIALQSIACALTLPPLYALVRRSSNVSIARMATVVGFAYPALAGLAFNDFHENDFAPASILWMVWAFERGLPVAACGFAALALCVKEDQAVFLIAAGVAVFARFRGTRFARAGLFVAALSACVLWQYFAYVQPHAAAHAVWAPSRFYAWTMQDVRPFLTIGLLQRVGFIALTFVPLVFLPFRSRLMWLAALPLGEVLLSRMPTTFTMGTHYAGAWIGWVLAAFALVVRRMPELQARRALCWCAALCVVEFIVADPLHPGLNLRGIEARDVRLDAALSALSPYVAVSTQEEAYTHLALSNPRATVFPEHAWMRVTTPFALTDTDFPHSPRLQEYGPAVRAPCFVPVRRFGSVVLYRALCWASSSARSAATARSGH